MMLYHGSDVVIERPDVTLNRGFSDLGQGFYLTDSLDAAQGRAASRARRTGIGRGVVSAFEFDETCIPWVELPLRDGEAVAPEGPFAVRFAADEAGFAAWIAYVVSCRRGNQAIEGLGEPVIVRAWIANDLVEMVYTGGLTASEAASYVESDALTAQYCLRDQAVLDELLHFRTSIELPA